MLKYDTGRMSESEQTADPDAVHGSSRAISWLLLLALVLYSWNAISVTPLSGYDAGGHAGYILTLLEEHRLPHPLEGWSTFHPPAYYLLAAAVWTPLAPLGATALSAGLRAISALSILAAAVVLQRLLAARGFGLGPSAVAVALALFLPCSQLAGTMLGNEALGVAFSSLALAGVLELHRSPSRLGAALRAGLFTGLALATKFTGLFVAAACIVPFLRRGLDRRAVGAAALLAATAAAIAGPVYLRNAWLTGSPVPLTRHEKGAAAWWGSHAVLRERRLGDYLGFPLSVLRRPTLLMHAGEVPGKPYNEAMINVWGAAYASFWYDAFAHRIPYRVRRRGDEVWAGPLLTGLGLLPTALMLLGLALCTRDILRGGLRTPEAPLVLMTAVGLATFVTFTARTPSLTAAKGSYLLPLLVPAGLFFARGVETLHGRLRRAALALSASAALASAIVFTSDLVSPPRGAAAIRNTWSIVAKQLPDSHIGEAVAIFLGTGQ
jgi:hypothetical protein